MKTIALGFLATVIAASSALAGDGVMNKDYQPPVTSPCFRDHELQLDVFGSFMNLPYGHDDAIRNTNFRRDNERDGGGGGVGVNYFFTRYIGIGVDADFDSNIGGVANYTGKFILRLPIETHGICIAPYIFAGGGGESLFDDGGNNNNFFNGLNGRRFRHDTLGSWMVGGGLEWRVTPRFGVFVEGRYTWTARYSNENGLNYDNDMARVGLRVAF
jgi:opacity protein-like surface antigen